MKNLTKLLIPIFAGTFSFNSFSQNSIKIPDGYLVKQLPFNYLSHDSIKTADGYTLTNKEGHIIKDVVIKGKDKDVYEYNLGKLIKLTTFSKDMKNREYVYNEKGRLMTETIYNKEGKIKEVINREEKK